MSEYVSDLENTIRLDGLLSSQATIAADALKWQVRPCVHARARTHARTRTHTSCIGTQTWQLLVIVTSLTEHLSKCDTESGSYDWV